MSQAIHGSVNFRGQRITKSAMTTLILKLAPPLSGELAKVKRSRSMMLTL